MSEGRRTHRVPINRQTLTLFIRMVRNLYASEVGTTAIAMVAALVGLLLAINGLNVVNSYVARDFMTAISLRDRTAFLWYAMAYATVFAGSTMADVLYGFTVGRLGLLWRVSLTQRILGGYLNNRAYYQLTATNTVSNPDQRITEDVRNLTTATLTFVLLIVNGSFTIIAFAGVLWTISPLLFGVAVGYAAVGSLLTLVLGRPLIWLNYNQSDKEAVFRADLIHVRENAESLALSHREPLITARLLRHLDELAANFKQLIAVSRNLGFFTTGYNYLIQLIPALVVAPLYIRGEVEFGVITQSAMAFGQLLGAFSLLITQFQSISSYAAVLARVASLTEGIDQVQSMAGRIEVRQEDGRMAYEALTLRASVDGPPLVNDLSVSVPRGTRCLIVGTEEAAPTALFRATAGTWDVGGGRIIRPGGDQMLFLPERPYVPPGTLRELLAGARQDGQAQEADLARVVQAFELEDIVTRAGGLDVEHDWDDFLPLHDQHLLTFARVCVFAPQFVFMDRISNTLNAEQFGRILKLLSDHSITYVTIAGLEDRRDDYDAVLELLPAGAWKWHPAVAAGALSAPPTSRDT
jgi:vitamin B12/bleomycin/antimicrobial peptide transport system ATP-binding/permease protein